MQYTERESGLYLHNRLDVLPTLLDHLRLLYLPSLPGRERVLRLGDRRIPLPPWLRVDTVNRTFSSVDLDHWSIYALEDTWPR